jgi:ParB family chromosome partitioning protein
MSAPKRGLGRGLDALLGDDRQGGGSRGLQTIAVRRIAPNPSQPRTVFDAAALDELRASIVAFGVLVPILVRPRGTDYELIAGERRWRAATAAGLESIPAIVREADDRESLEVAIIENLQRENLDPLEEAMGFAHLMESFGFTQERVAERVGRSRPAIANALRLLSLSDSIKALIRSRTLTVGHARALLAFPEDAREAFAYRIVREGLTVRAVEAAAGASAPPKSPKRPARAQVSRTADLDDVEGRLRYRFGTHVSIVPAGDGGSVTLRYAGDADLMRIVDLLLGENP